MNGTKESKKKCAGNRLRVMTPIRMSFLLLSMQKTEISWHSEMCRFAYLSNILMSIIWILGKNKYSDGSEKAVFQKGDLLYDDGTRQLKLKLILKNWTLYHPYIIV